MRSAERGDFDESKTWLNFLLINKLNGDCERIILLAKNIVSFLFLF